MSALFHKMKPLRCCIATKALLLIALSLMLIPSAQAKISKHSNGTIEVTRGNSYFTIWDYSAGRGQPLYGIKGQDRTLGQYAESNPPVKCAASMLVKFNIDANHRKDKSGLSKNKPLTAKNMQIEDFLHAYREAYLYICPEIQTIEYEAKVQFAYPDRTAVVYYAKTEAASKWRIQEGEANGLPTSDTLVNIRYRTSDWTVEVNVQGKCREEPIIALSRVKQSTMTKMPNFQNYKAAASQAASAYFKNCPTAEIARMSLSPLPHDYSCKRGETCQLTVLKSALGTVDTGNVKYIRGARNGIPPGGFRNKSTSEIALENSGQFKSYRAGVYLSAIYAGDFEVARQQDRLFSQPYRQMMNGRGGKDMATMMLLPVKGFGMTQQDVDALAAAMSALYGKLSMIDMAMATYLFSYPNIYSACLEPNAPGFTLTQEWQEVTTQGGFEIHRGPVQTSTTTYRANRKFISVLEGVIGTSPQTAGFIDQLLRGSPALSIADTNAGIYAIMRDNKCDSPVIQQLETNLIKYWNQYQKRIKPIRAQMEKQFQ